MRTKKIFIELVADRATVAVVDRNRVALSQILPFDAHNDPNDWVKQLSRLSSELKAFVDTHKLAGSSAVVVYQSPTAAVNLAAAPIASGSDANEVASLSCLDALPYSAMAAVVTADTIGRDRGGDNRQIHVLVAAERDDVAGAIVEAVTDAGLNYQSATPIDVLICRRLAMQALRTTGEAAGYLYLGEHSSYFVVGGAGHLAFERRLSFDVHAMVTKLRSPIVRSRSGEAESIELDLEDARTIVQNFGVPDRNAVVHEPVGLTGAQIIPLLQPLLQRLIVEMRQSLRFGVSEAQRDTLAINLSGPGVRVPNLAETIGRELNVDIVPDEGWTEFDFNNPACACSEFTAALRSGQILGRFNLQPNELASRRRTQRLKKWLWTGAAAALAIIVVDYLQYGAQLNGAREQADMLSLGAGDIEALRATSVRLEGTIAALSELEQRVTTETASNVSFRAIMNELTRVTPSSVRLTSFNFNEVEGAMVGRLNGYVFDGDGDGGQLALKSFIDALRESPLLEDVRLGDVQLGTVDGMQGRRFDAVVTAIPVPWQLVEQITSVSIDADVPQGGIQ